MSQMNNLCRCLNNREKQDAKKQGQKSKPQWQEAMKETNIHCRTAKQNISMTKSGYPRGSIKLI